MRYFFSLLVLLCFSITVWAQSEKGIHIIPQPVSVDIQIGHFTLNQDTRILYDKPSAEGVADLIQSELATSTGFKLKIKQQKKTAPNSICLQSNYIYDSTLGKAGYLLDVNPEKVLISANNPKGFFYAFQSLKQLFPPQIENDSVAHHVHWIAQSVSIMDYPQFKWRGLMLDVSRHFFTVDEVKKYIDEMAKYKYNIFHWHLTDDQGWRIEIKGLPKLTEVGAWRIPSFYTFQKEVRPEPGEKTSYGGYYTQAEIKDIIAYAKDRFVTIVPEIDVPGHSLAMISAYPNLSCTKKQYPIYPGDAPDSIDNALCVANDSTWTILDKVFTQVAALFPSKYIHVGGDEANRSFWANDPKDKALMKKRGLKSPEELQSYFEKKLEKLVKSKGKKIIGWDEILQGGLAPDAAVMSWHGLSGGKKAAKMGHPVIMTPWGKTYLSQLQGDPLIEPEGPPRYNRLNEIYKKTKLLPKEIDSQNILGGEGCLWTEYVPNYRHAEYMTWPRALALSEVFWGSRTSWEDFVRRVEANLPYLREAQVKYASSMFEPIISAVKVNDSLKVVLQSAIPGVNLYYRFDGTDPDKYSPIYKGKPLSIPNGASQIRVVSYKEEKQVGRQINCPMDVLKRRVK